MGFKQIIAEANIILQHQLTGYQSQKYLNEDYIEKMEKIKAPQIEFLLEKIQILLEREKQLNLLKLSEQSMIEVENLIETFTKSQELVESGTENIKQKLRKEQEINQVLQRAHTQSENEFLNKQEILNIQKGEFLPYIYQMEEYSNSINNNMLAEIRDTNDPGQQNAFKALAILIITQVHKLQQTQILNREEYRQWNEAQKVFSINIKDIMLNFDIKLVKYEDIEIVQEILRDGVLDLQNHQGFDLYNWTQVCLNYWEAYQPIQFEDEQLIQLHNISHTQKQQYLQHLQFMKEIQIQFDEEQFQYNEAKQFIELNQNNFDIAIIQMGNNQRIIEIQKIISNQLEFLYKYYEWRNIILINEIVQSHIISNKSYEICAQIEKLLYKIVSVEDNIQLVANSQHTYPIFNHKFKIMENNQISIIFDPFQLYKIFQEYLRHSNQQICSLTIAQHIINYETLQLNNLKNCDYLFLMLNSINNIKSLVQYLKNNHCKPKVIIVLQNLQFEETLNKQFDTDYINLTFSVKLEDSLINFVNQFFNTSKIINQESYIRLKEQDLLIQMDLSDSDLDLQSLSEKIKNIQNKLYNLQNNEPQIDYRYLAQFIPNMYLTFRSQMNNIGFPDYLDKVQRQCQSMNAYQCIEKCINFTLNFSNLSQQEYFEKIIPIMSKEYVFQIYAEIYQFLTFELYLQLIECFRIISDIKKDFQLNFEVFFNNYQNQLNQLNSEITKQLIIENNISQVNEKIQRIFTEIQQILRHQQDQELLEKDVKSLISEQNIINEEKNQIEFDLELTKYQLEQFKNEINEIKFEKQIELDPKKCFELSSVLNDFVFEQFVQIMILHNKQTDQAQIWRFFKNKSSIQKLNQNPLVSEESIRKYLSFRNTCDSNQSSNVLSYHLEEYIQSIVKYNENKQKESQLILKFQNLENYKDSLIDNLYELDKKITIIEKSLNEKQHSILLLKLLFEKRRLFEINYQKNNLKYYSQATSQFKQYIQNLKNYRFQLIIIQILQELESESNYSLLKQYLTIDPRSEEYQQLIAPCIQINNINTMKLVLAFNIDQIKNQETKYPSNSFHSNKILENIQQYFKFIDSWMQQLIEDQFVSKDYHLAKDLIDLLNLQNEEEVQRIERLILSNQVHYFYHCQDPQYLPFKVLIQLLAIDQKIQKIFDVQQKSLIEQILKSFFYQTNCRDLNIHLYQILKQSTETCNLIRMFATAIILQVYNQISLKEFCLESLSYHSKQINKLKILSIVMGIYRELIKQYRNMILIFNLRSDIVQYIKLKIIKSFSYRSNKIQ